MDQPTDPLRAVPEHAPPERTTALPRWLQTWWLRVLVVFLCSRLYSTGLLLVAWRRQGGGSKYWPDGRPPFAVFLARWWDGWWYQQVATDGYPSTVPLDAQGHPAVNAWAFYPGYPELVRALHAATGLPWAPLALTVSVVAGAGAMVVLHRLVEVGAPRAVTARPHLPLLTVGLVSIFPSAAVLGLAYTESLSLLLLAAALLALVRRRYLWALVGTVMLGMTRAVALPIAAVVLVHWVAREREARKSGAPLRVQERASLGVLLAGSVAAGFAWQTVAGIVTGDPDAYLRTEQAWRAGRTIAPFSGWVHWATGSTLRAVLVIALLLAVVTLLRSRSARRLGPELYTWAAAYPLYLVAVTDLISSQLRFWLLAFPIFTATIGLVTNPRRRTWWFGMLLVGAALAQAAWVFVVWVYVPGETGFWRSP